MFEALARSHSEKEVPPLFSAANDKETKRGAAWLAARIERSKRLNADNLETETVTITPALAELMLARNSSNRVMRQAKISKYAKIITEGRWKLTAQGISFSRDGNLNDGQHRLNAIVASGCAVMARVTFGEDAEVFDVLDTHSPRNGGDALHIAGFKNSKNASAAVRVVAGADSDHPWALAVMSNDEVLDYVRDNPTICDAVAYGSAVSRSIGCPAAPITAAVFLIERDTNEPLIRVGEFFDKLASGENLQTRDPILGLRNAFIQKRFDRLGTGGSNFGSSKMEMTAAVIQTWNRWRVGKSGSSQMVRWTPDRPFPIAE